MYTIAKRFAFSASHTIGGLPPEHPCARLHGHNYEVEVILHEEYTSPLNPLGIKGAGESGITGVGAAIASAIDDAIGMPGAVTQLPVTPQRLKQILNARRSAP